MRLASLADGSRDGALVVVDGRGARMPRPADVAPSLQRALDEWPRCEPLLRDLAERLDRGGDSRFHPARRGEGRCTSSARLRVGGRFGVPQPCRPRSPSARRRASGDARGRIRSSTREAPASARDRRTRSCCPTRRSGLDFEGEIAVVLGDVPRATPRSGAADYVRLLMLANDVTYRDMVPAELKKGFGFFVSKPSTAFSPFAVTPDELGGAFHDGRAFLRLVCTYNGARCRRPRDGRRDALFVRRISSHTRRRHARSPRGRSSAAARCRTTTRRVAWRAWRSGVHERRSRSVRRARLT